MRRTRFRLVAVAAAALATLLTACGSGAGTGTEPAAAGETRVVTDDFGTQVTVPATPMRVVTTHFLLTMGAMDLGVTPVGTPVWIPGNVTPAYATALADVPVVTSQSSEPELEKIAAQTPDLILATSFNDEQMIGRLREIAPTFVLSVSAAGVNATSWSDRIRQIADVLGRTAEADRLEAAFAARKQEIMQADADRIHGTTVAVVGGYQDNNAAVFAAGSAIGQILTSLGFTYSPQAEAVAGSSQNGIGNVSFEAIGTSVGDADVLFLGGDLRGEPSTFVAALQQTQLYKELPAVQANRVTTFKPQITGYTDATFVLDQVERALTGTQG